MFNRNLDLIQTHYKLEYDYTMQKPRWCLCDHIVHLVFIKCAILCHYKRPARYFISTGFCKTNKGKTLKMKKLIDLHVVVFVVVVVVLVAVSEVAVFESCAAEEYTNINLLMVKRPPF